MSDPIEFYRNSIESYSRSLKNQKRKIAQSSLLRLMVFVLIAITVYFVFGDFRMMLFVILSGIFVFVYLVYRHNELIYERDLLNNLIFQNERELQVHERNYTSLDPGRKYDDPNHEYSQDIDMFGEGSFYQYLNRTSLPEGGDLLAKLLLENSTSNISQKQEIIQELAAMPEWRQKFSAIASLVKVNVESKEIVKWINEYKSFVPHKMRYVAFAFSSVSLILAALYFFEFISGYFIASWFGLGLLITGLFTKKVNKLASDVSEIQSTFEQFQRLIVQIEKTTFSSSGLQEKRNRVIFPGKKASLILKKFAKNLDALDQRNTMIFGIIWNGFFLWDIAQSFNIEKWVATYGNEVEKWFETILFFDAFNSLANFAFNHPKYVFPSLTDSEKDSILDIQKAGHPLLNENSMITNDFRIDNEEFFIITGANMAGKSTFLRTVSLLIVMSNVGLPVCAEKATYRPIKLITSMRTTDNLSNDESYFFSELKRLKFIVDKIEMNNYFIILDEILKGTNSTDKAVGSRKFVEKLVRSNSTGIIATHDLSLCDISDSLSQVKNFYFDAEIINDELFFDYTLKKGVCQNMNASFLLKKMKIVD